MNLADLEQRYAVLRQRGLALDLTRGKPAADQLALSNTLDGILAGNFSSADGTDTRNYGGIRGLPEARKLGAEMLHVAPDEILAGDNSSLLLMYLYVETAHLFGVRGADSAWQRAGSRAGGAIKFLCPVPGYDRHFAICEQLGIEMLTVGMRDDGPDMDEVERLVSADPLIKGIWCVPKHSNPTGCTYSDDVVRRFAALPKRAGQHFRIMWDNAYAVHDFAEPVPLLSLMECARAEQTTDSVVIMSSTSKITFAGAGISFLATSVANLQHFEKRLSAMTIGPNKVNQLRHMRLLPDIAAVQAQMRRHAELIVPKFRRTLHFLERELGNQRIAEWTEPRGGYFISLDTQPGLAKEVVRLAADAGIKVTPAGSTFPYGHDPEDRNIRIAPTFPSPADLEQALAAFCLCLQLATARRNAAR